MKSKLLIIIGLVLIFGVIVVTDISQNQLEWGKVMREDIHNPLQMDIYKLENTSDQLRGIFASCNCHERVKANPDTIERCPQPFIDWENTTHYIDNNSCEWTYLEKYLDENNELNFGIPYDGNGIIIDDLQRIFDWCNYPNGEPVGSYFDWNNHTHHIDNNSCEWEYIGPATNSINKWAGAPIYKEQKENEK